MSKLLTEFDALPYDLREAMLSDLFFNFSVNGSWEDNAKACGVETIKEAFHVIFVVDSLAQAALADTLARI